VVETTMDVSGWLCNQLEQASPDLLRAMVKDFAEALMRAEVDAVLRRWLRGAEPGAGQPPKRLSGARVGHAGRVNRARGAEAARGFVRMKVKSAGGLSSSR
jgi:hypothetical protein